MVKLNAPLDTYLLEEIRPLNKPASKFKRLFNLVLDFCSVFLLLIVIFFILILVGAEEWVPTRESSDELNGLVEFPQSSGSVLKKGGDFRRAPRDCRC